MKYKTKPTQYGWWVEYRLVGYKNDQPVFKEVAVFPDGHEEKFRVFGGVIFGYSNTRLGLRGWKPPEDIVEVLQQLPEGALIS